MSTTSISSWQDVQRYCKDRLDEIRVINTHQNPSGFVCIAAFLGFLSRLAFGTNKMKQPDGTLFRKFVTSFMPAKYHGHEDMMYRTFRCGIVHAMSFDDELSVENVDFLKTQPKGVQGFSKLAITHNRQYDSLCAKSSLLPDANGMYVLVADILCNDIESAINSMFAVQNVRDNCERFILCQRPITAVKQQDTTRDVVANNSSEQTEKCLENETSLLSASHSTKTSRDSEPVHEIISEI